MSSPVSVFQGLAQDATLTDGSLRGQMIPKKDPLLLFADDFSQGPCGWRGLVNGTAAQGTVLPSTMPTSGKAALRMGIEDGGASYNPDIFAMAIKRFTLPYDPKTRQFHRYVSAEMDIAVGAYWNTSGRWNSPRTIDIGLDAGWSADASGADNRTFYAVRYQLIDESNADALTQKFQLRTTPNHGGNSVYVDLPDAPGSSTPIKYAVGYNENKVNVFRFQMVVDLTDRRLAGMAVNGYGYGLLAPTPDNSLHDLAEPWSAPLNQGGVASFYGGMNLCVELYSRTNTGQTSGDVYLTNPRVEVYS